MTKYTETSNGRYKAIILKMVTDKMKEDVTVPYYIVLILNHVNFHVI